MKDSNKAKIYAIGDIHGCLNHLINLLGSGQPGLRTKQTGVCR